MDEKEIDKVAIYQIKRLPKFDKSYKDLIKKHYRKNKKGEQEFSNLVQEFLDNQEFLTNPSSDEFSDSLNFPSNTAEEGFEFRKKRWRRLPYLQGASRFGRLIFLIYHPKKVIYLVWFYTHAEFQKPQSQPPDKELKQQINLAKEDIIEKQ
jgi:hypothetical protein